MTEPLLSPLTLTGDNDVQMCGPDGCLIPASHPVVITPVAPDHDETEASNAGASRTH